MSAPLHVRPFTSTTTAPTSMPWSTESRRQRRSSGMTLSDRSAEISALYQELILDHYRRPRNKGELANPDASVTMKNPLCGDEIAVHQRFDGDAVGDLSFSGRGCSISQASASMMTQLVKGKSRTEIESLRSRFRNMVMGN